MRFASQQTSGILVHQHVFSFLLSLVMIDLLSQEQNNCILYYVPPLIQIGENRGYSTSIATSRVPQECPTPDPFHPTHLSHKTEPKRTDSKGIAYFLTFLCHVRWKGNTQRMEIYNQLGTYIDSRGVPLGMKIPNQFSSFRQIPSPRETIPAPTERISIIAYAYKLRTKTLQYMCACLHLSYVMSPPLICLHISWNLHLSYVCLFLETYIYEVLYLLQHPNNIYTR